MKERRANNHCPNCLFLGQFGQYDLYYCPREVAHYYPVQNAEGPDTTFPKIVTINTNYEHHEYNAESYNIHYTAFAYERNKECIRLACKKSYIPKTIADRLTHSKMGDVITKEEMKGMK